jgi:hypothetical protein
VAERQLFKPQTVLLRLAGLRGGGGKSGDGQTLGRGVVLGEPGFSLEERGRRDAGVDGEKVFSPKLAGRGGARCKSGLRYRALH